MIERNGSGLSHGLDDQIERAISQSLPHGEQDRWRALFEFARHLRGMFDYATTDPRDLEPYLRRWFKAARPMLLTKDYETYYIEFLLAWDDVRFPMGTDPIRLAEEEARRNPVRSIPKWMYRVQRTASLCRAFQNLWGRKPFYLSTRIAGRLIQKSHEQAGRYLRILQKRSWIVKVEQGTWSGRRASRFNYIAYDRDGIAPIIAPVPHRIRPGDVSRIPR